MVDRTVGGGRGRGRLHSEGRNGVAVGGYMFVLLLTILVLMFALDGLETRSDAE